MPCFSAPRVELLATQNLEKAAATLELIRIAAKNGIEAASGS
jgi:hypothetical protein